ncbi:Nuclear pore complex protein Nup88 [Armadillidium nasatum]|uniref:Nuclear pore complex protein Nup88 n=1 Tax=Armadillidium nasatum TaxID=96803 RepID=A0A5N5SQ17_9CRUS|nr:Nuclear pore complex protein Nup88 [Armadillidium nasatum]
MKEEWDSMKKLSDYVSSMSGEPTLKQDEKYQLLCIVNDIILVWCQENSTIAAQLLQHEHLEAESSKIQTLILSKPPFWEVKCIIANKSGTGVLLVGNEGVAVVELPKRWGNPNMFEGGKESLSCRVEYVGEQFLMCNPSVKIISADWHPGSLNHTYITILSSDNYLRLYNLSYLSIPEQAIAVAKSSNIQKESGKFGVTETVVDFGIGFPVCSGVETSFNLGNSLGNQHEEVENEQLENYSDLLWPLFFLYSNGDVYYTYMSLYQRNVKRKTLYGPLSFLPSSFDNYGIDFCSLLVLPSSPIVLVIANTNGLLHHCIVMDAPRVDESDQIEDITVSISELKLEPSSIYLHVYESIQIKRSSQNWSMIYLLPDPSTPARYLISHNEGLHCVCLPFVERLLPDDINFPEYDLECQVEYLLSTRSTSTDKPCFLVGCCATLSGKIFIILNSGDIQSFSLPSVLTPKLPFFSLQSLEEENAPSSKIYKESFEDFILSILRRTKCQPLLISRQDAAESEPEEYLNVFNMTTANLRENYIKPQIKAREEIKRRHKNILEQKEFLKNEVIFLEKEKASLTDKAHELAEKYEETNDRHSRIMRRLEIVIGNLVRRMPVMSANEKSMLKELEEVSEKRKTLLSQIDQIHSKHEWQTNQVKKDKTEECFRSNKTSVLSESQLTCLQVSLRKESERLAALSKKINLLKKELSV